MTNSRQKGKRGELEFAALLRDLGIEARRSQQYCGTEGHADITSAIPGVHWEVKRYAKIASLRFLEQAERDCLANDLPVVALREDRGEWTLQLRAKDLPRLVAKLSAALATSGTTKASSPTSSSDGEPPSTSPSSRTPKS
jgi:hypothetical protein